ncbi:MAG: hypothetical protein JWQ69_2629, partial [Pseudomonas sp.]|nr:hypothetical protein [Pseudomonas sp.]
MKRMISSCLLALTSTTFIAGSAL